MCVCVCVTQVIVQRLEAESTGAREQLRADMMRREHTLTTRHAQEMQEAQRTEARYTHIHTFMRRLQTHAGADAPCSTHKYRIAGNARSMTRLLTPCLCVCVCVCVCVCHTQASGLLTCDQ